MEKLNQSPSTLLEGKKGTPLRAEYLTAIVECLVKLERHYRRSLDEMEKQIYIDALRELTPRKIELATHKALRTLKRMPLVADMLEFANERDTSAVYDFRPSHPEQAGKYCQNCRPDGYVLETHPVHGSPYKVARRCPCQKGRD